MYNVQSFSSLVELNNKNLANASSSLINGLKILHDNQWYVAGNLALNEGEVPHKAINSSPDDRDYELLMKASLLLVKDKVEQPVVLTVGFPYSTYHIYKERAIARLVGTHKIEFDSSVFSSGNKSSFLIDVKEVNVLPEIVGCTIALRRGEENAEGQFFVLSCGFGTFESLLSSNEGIIEQSMVSAPGLKYAVNLVLNELSKTQYLKFRSPHLIDDAFKKGYILLNRKRIDLREIRRNAIVGYYNEVISPYLKEVINDSNLTKANKIYLCGGGVHYSDLVECFQKEFEEIAQIIIPAEPEYMAAKGYALNSLRRSGEIKSVALGVDIGNATTSVVNFD